LLRLAPDPKRREVGRGSLPFLAHGSRTCHCTGVIMGSMLWNNALLAAVISLHAAPPAAPGPQVYKIELAGNQTVWSEDLPKDSGTLVLFHRYPGGLLVCV